MHKLLIALCMAVVFSLIVSSNLQAKDLKGAIVVMDLTTNAFQIEMADQAVECGK